MGSRLILKIEDNYTVTGVIKDLPDFHLPAKAIASFKSVEDHYNLSDENWSWGMVSYVMLADNHDKELLEKKMNIQFSNMNNGMVKEPEFFVALI